MAEVTICSYFGAPKIKSVTDSIVFPSVCMKWCKASLYRQHLLYRQSGQSDPGIEPRSPVLQADSLPSESQGKPKETGVGNLSLLQGIFLTHELNQGLLQCRWILYQLSYEGSVWIWELDHKERCVPKNWCFCTVVLRRVWESLGLKKDQVS